MQRIAKVAIKGGIRLVDNGEKKGEQCWVVILAGSGDKATERDVQFKTVENADLKAQIQENVFANVALKNELRKLKGNNMDTKFTKPSILGKPVLQSPRNQSVVRQPNAFKSERPNFLKPRFASQVDVNNVLSKPVTPHYFPKVRESVSAKSHHVIAPAHLGIVIKNRMGQMTWLIITT
ncbi:hypothetical protein Tco_1357636 [Tanacetum coccineum]